MARINPLIQPLVSAIFTISVISVTIYLNVNLLKTAITLKNFDNIMSVGAGFNLVLGVLKGIRNSICVHYTLRFKGAQSNLSDKLSGVVNKKIISEEYAQQVDRYFDELKFSIEDNKTIDTVQKLTVYFSIIIGILYCIGLTFTAFNPAFSCVGWIGVPIVLFILIPIAVYIFSVALLAAYPEYKLNEKLKMIEGIDDLDEKKLGISPTKPKV